MIFDVMVKEGFNKNEKQIVNVYRVHDSKLNKMLRDIQDARWKRIIAVIPLFRQKKEEVDIAVGMGEEETSLEEQLITGKKYMKSMGLTLDSIEQSDAILDHGF